MEGGHEEQHTREYILVECCPEPLIGEEYVDIGLTGLGLGFAILVLKINCSQVVVFSSLG